LVVLKNRYFGLDFCRATFMILGIFYHAALIYTPEQNWRVISPLHSDFFHFIKLFIHNFRMEAFYLISGFFYVLVFLKNRPGFMIDRIQRVIVPMIFCGMTLNILMNDFSSNFQFTTGWEHIMSGEWMGHLWFLGNLAVYFLVGKFVAKYVQNFKLLNVNKLLFVICVITPVLGLVAKVISNLTYDQKFLFLEFHFILYYFPYFVLGMVCFVNKDLFFDVISNKNLMFVCGFVGFSGFFIDILFEFNSHTVEKVIEYSYRGFLMIAMIALVNNIGNRQSDLTLRFSRASYSIYLLHQPLLVVLYSLCAQFLPDQIYIQYLIFVLGITGLTFYIHELVISRFCATRLLFNGSLK
jgi:glucans biosynthesis protein C